MSPLETAAEFEQLVRQPVPVRYGDHCDHCEQRNAIVTLARSTTLPQIVREQAAEIERLQNYKAAYLEWLEKTEWVQERQDCFPFRTLGIHRADILRKEIERLQARVNELISRE